MDLLCFFVAVLCVFAIDVSAGSVSWDGDRRNLCTDDISGCKQYADSEVCSGRGNCVCGNCQCFTHRGDIPLSYTGQWCQCDDSRCPSYNGAVCGGSDHGVCACGFCNCFGNYTGKDCGCSVHTDKCRSEDGKICGGNGNCVCNQCQCAKGYEGKDCTICKDCQLCDFNKECVQCIAHNKDQSDCQNKCQHLKVKVVKNLPESSEESKRSEVRCNYDDVAFVVETDENNHIQIKAASLKGNDRNGAAKHSSSQLLLIVGLNILASIPLLLA